MACSMGGAIENYDPYIIQIRNSTNTTGVSVNYHFKAKGRASIPKSYGIIYYNTTESLKGAKEKVIFTPKQDFSEMNSIDITLSESGHYYFWLSLEDEKRKDKITSSCKEFDFQK